MPPISTPDGRGFDDVLEAIGRAASTGPDERTAAAAYRGRIVLECLLNEAGQAASPTHETLTGLYVERPPQPQAAQADYASVAEELGLAPGLSPRQLNALRRSFARSHHPDRVSPQLREEATRRMAIANILIDRALKEGRGTA
jgi:hypothetical protein